jgi:hypothetical protein
MRDSPNSLLVAAEARRDAEKPLLRRIITKFTVEIRSPSIFRQHTEVVK